MWEGLAFVTLGAGPPSASAGASESAATGFFAPVLALLIACTLMVARMLLLGKMCLSMEQSHVI